MLEGEEIESKSFNKLKNDSHTLLMKTRELSTLHSIKVFCIQCQDKLAEVNTGQFEEACEVKGAGNAYQSVIEEINKKIEILKQN